VILGQPLGHLRTFSTYDLDPANSKAYDDLEAEARRPIEAQDLHDLVTGNTVEVARIEELQPGDLITQSHHVQLVVNNPAVIDAPDKSGVVQSRHVLEITQGNPTAGQGTKIEHRAWDLDAGNYYEEIGGAWRHVRQEDFRKQWRAGVCHGRRWNFRFFDRFIPQRMVWRHPRPI
jgi:hypothetical protein